MTPIEPARARSDWRDVLFERSSLSKIIIKPVIVYWGNVHITGIRLRGALPYYTWWLIERGSVVLTVNDRSQIVTPGQWVFIPFGMQREQQFSKDARLASISFLAQWGENRPLLSCPGVLTGQRSATPEICEKAELVFRCLPEEGLSYWLQPASLEGAIRFDVALQEFISQLFLYATQHGATIRRFEPGDSRLNWVLNDIENRLQAGPLPFKEWQVKTGLGRSQLDRLARYHLMMSLHAYRDQLLLDVVCKALRDRNMLIKQLVEKFGFVDSAHLCRWLRARIGQSPSQYINSI